MVDKEETTAKQMQNRMTEVDTKRVYLALVLLFVANFSGVFAASIPPVIFVALFLVVVGIDAYS